MKKLARTCLIIKRKLLPVIAAILFTLVVICVGFLTVVVVSVHRSFGPITKVKKYSEVLERRWPQDARFQTLIKHFPRSIPPDAKDVKFYFQISIRCWADIQLRYTTSHDKISELYDRFSKEKTKSFVGADSSDHMNMKNGIRTTFFYTSGSKDRKFPKDFEIMVFDIDESLSKGCRGVAISKKKNEIVYWAKML